MTAKDFVQLLLLGIASAAPATALGGAHGELLEPEEAFRVSARPLDERTIAVEFRIADGYYLYRDRISFATASGEPISGARLPRGTIKEDQFFGRTEVFREMVSIWVPVPTGSAEAGRTGLKVTSQGCWDGGVCYTPLEQFVSVQLAGASGDNAGAGAAVSRLSWGLAAAALAAGLALGWVSAGSPASVRGLIGGARHWRSLALVLVFGAAAGAAVWIAAPYLPDVLRPFEALKSGTAPLSKGVAS